jgi:hypothetical protein
MSLAIPYIGADLLLTPAHDVALSALTGLPLAWNGRVSINAFSTISSLALTLTFTIVTIAGLYGICSCISGRTIAISERGIYILPSLPKPLYTFLEWNQVRAVQFNASKPTRNGKGKDDSTRCILIEFLHRAPLVLTPSEMKSQDLQKLSTALKQYLPKDKLQLD